MTTTPIVMRTSNLVALVLETLRVRARPTPDDALRCLDDTSDVHVRRYRGDELYWLDL